MPSLAVRRDLQPQEGRRVGTFTPKRSWWPSAPCVTLFALIFSRCLAATVAADAKEVSPELLEARGELPGLSVAGLRLTKVFRLSPSFAKDGDWTFTRTAVPSDYRALSSRRLAVGDQGTLDDLSDVPFGSYTTPRDRVRATVVLNAAVLSEAAYNATYWWLEHELVYDDKQQVFFPEHKLQAGRNLSGNFSDLRAQFDVAALQNESTEIRESAGADKLSGHFKGVRGTACIGKGTDSEPCSGDSGVALSVYEDTTHRVIVFHGGWDPSEYDHMMWAHKIWILERFELELNLMWSLQAQQPATKEMSERAYGGTDGVAAERKIRCAFKDHDYKPVPDANKLGIASNLNAADVEKSGLWNVVKQIVRSDGVIPEGGDKVKTVILTGSGRGGTFAALVSLWLKRVDGSAYTTYVFAPDGGWQCFARRLYTKDLTPHDDHSHIIVYAHIMDAFAGAVDRTAGKVCLYGATNFTGAVLDFCSKIVGHTGPQLLFRGNSGPPDPSEAVLLARRNFDACHYFTHSIWYAAILLLDDEVLDIDGSSDAGCRQAAPVPKTDTLEECPLKTEAETDCSLEESAMQALPVVAMMAVAGGLFGVIACSAITGYCLLRRVRNEQWLFNGLKKSNNAKSKAEESAKKARAMRERKNDREARKIQKKKEKMLGGNRRAANREDKEMKGVLIGARDPEFEALEEGTAGSRLPPIGEEEQQPQEGGEDGAEPGTSQAAGTEVEKKRERKGKKVKKEKKDKDKKASDGQADEEQSVEDCHLDKKEKRKKDKKERKDKHDDRDAGALDA